MSLQDPLKKMSKSDENPNGYIMLLDEPKQIVKKLKKAVTDSDEQARIYFDRTEKPGVSNLLTLLSVATKRSIEDLVPEYEDKMYGHLKKDTADAVVNDHIPSVPPSTFVAVAVCSVNSPSGSRRYILIAVTSFKLITLSVSPDLDLAVPLIIVPISSDWIVISVPLAISNFHIS